jgi:hypothetical protein
MSEMEYTSFLLTYVYNGNTANYQLEMYSQDGSAFTLEDSYTTVNYQYAYQVCYHQGTPFILLANSGVPGGVEEVEVYRYGKVCHPDCGNDCDTVPTGAAQEGCLTCPPTHNTITVNSNNFCELKCVAGKYADLANGSCLDCDTTCCGACHVDRENAPNNVLCDSITDATYSFSNNVCTLIPTPPPPTPSPSAPIPTSNSNLPETEDGVPEYHILNMSTVEEKKIWIIFDRPPTSFTLSDNLVVTSTGGW